MPPITEPLGDTSLLLALLALPGVGRVTARRIAEALDQPFRTARQLADTLQHLRSSIRRIPDITAQDCQNAIGAAQRQADACETLGLRILAIGSPAFPKRLTMIPNPPLILFARGGRSLDWDLPVVAIIGTRKPTEYGIQTGHRWGGRAAEARLPVVSGLALGCDTAAHQGCLDGGGTAIAIMAHGLDAVHPSQNRRLADEIIERGGCLLSEYAPGVLPRPNHFVERDRLQSGLAHGVLVIETDLEGGTMHPVHFAREQGREIAALRHPLEMKGQPQTRGNDMLIREGAHPIEHAANLTAFFDRVRTHARRAPLADPKTARQGQLRLSFVAEDKE